MSKKKEPASDGTGKPADNIHQPADPAGDDLGKSEKNPAAAADAEAVQSPSEVDVLRKELVAEHDQYLRILAEYDNFRKRSAKERECVYMDVRADTVEKFLPVFDNLERALAQATADEPCRKGIEMIMAQFTETLSQFGVKAIEAKGQNFDPARHNAIMHVEDSAFGESVIVEEFRKGFAMGDKIIRVSMVKVAN